MCPLGMAQPWLIALRTCGILSASEQLQNDLPAWHEPSIWSPDTSRSVSYSTTGGFARDVTISRLSLWIVIPLDPWWQAPNHGTQPNKNWGERWQDWRIWLRPATCRDPTRSIWTAHFYALNPSQYSDTGSFFAVDMMTFADQNWMDSHVDTSIGHNIGVAATAPTRIPKREDLESIARQDLEFS